MVQELPLPPGLLSEEAQESRTKHLRFYRRHHTRKCSLKKGYEDLYNRLILTSDPIILQHFPRRQKKGQPYSKEVLRLMTSPRDPGSSQGEVIMQEDGSEEELELGDA